MTQLLEAANANSIFINQDNIKKFANRLKKSLEKDSIKFKTSKCYDILAQTLGSSNWHELSQQLSAAPINKEVASLNISKNEKELKSIFDYPWAEFKYFISQICEQMGYSEKIKIFTLSLLEVIKDRNKKGSHLLWDKISIILSHNKFNLIAWANNNASLEHYLDLNPNLEENIKTNINTDLWPFFSAFSSGVGKQDDDPAITIMKIFKLLNYLHHENVILYAPLSQFKKNDITVNIKNYPILYDLINYINTQKTNENSLNLHEVIFNLYSQVEDCYNDSAKEIFRAKDNVIKSLLNNLDFCSYVISNIKERVYSQITYELHSNILKFNLKINHINFSEFKKYIAHEIFKKKTNIQFIELNIDINDQSHNIILTNKDNHSIIEGFIEYLRDDYHFKKMITEKNLSLKINSINF